MSFTRRNHYVPQWYQRRFLPERHGSYFFLKLRPKMKTLPDGRRVLEKECVPRNPATCFFETDLYTTRFGTVENDDIEKHLFGMIDTDGHQAIDHFCDYRPTNEIHEACHHLIDYMDAQALRTPRGLARIQQRTGFTDHNACLFAMQSIRQVHGTMWAECVWEIIDCSGSGVDLIVSDNPVTFYNRGLFPGARECAFPNEPGLELMGTQTLFPLRKDKLLALTHTQFARDPSYNPQRPRINPRHHAPTVFAMLDVITESRKLDTASVLKVNYIIKMRAHQYLAASTEEGLYPERRLKSTHWPKLCADEFLLPDPREITFSTGIMFGYADGRSAFSMDEYGRPIGAGGKDMEDKNRAREWVAMQRRKKRWEEKWGPLQHHPAHFRNNW